MMSDTQWNILYKMTKGWQLHSAVDGGVWAEKVVNGKHQSIRISRPTLMALSKRLWVTMAEPMKWPFQKWALTIQGRQAVQREATKRGAIA